MSIRSLLACLLILPVTLYAQEGAEVPPIEPDLTETFVDPLQLKFEYERELKIATIQHFYLNMVSSALLYNCQQEDKAESIMQTSSEVRNFIATRTEELVAKQPKFKDVSKISPEDRDTIESNIMVHLSGYWFGYKDASKYTVKLHPEICQRANEEADQLLSDRAKPAS